MLAIKYPRIIPYGDAAVLVEFGDVVDRQLNSLVIALDRQLAEKDIPGVQETMPAFRSLMIRFDPLVTDHVALEQALTPYLDGKSVDYSGGSKWHLPVCYHPEVGLDLDAIAKSCGLPLESASELHCQEVQHVYMIGFLPGHPYLGDLPAELNLSRREEPRLQVPRGSVGIANGLSVIYPVDCPGGWNIIGRTPVPLFSFASDTPSLLAPGDDVRFEPISISELARIEQAVAAGEWTASREALR